MVRPPKGRGCRPSVRGHSGTNLERTKEAEWANMVNEAIFVRVTWYGAPGDRGVPGGWAMHVAASVGWLRL